MRKESRAEVVGSGGGGDVYWIYWRTPEEWAALVEAWVDETAQKGTVLTLYELTEGEAVRGTGEFVLLLLRLYLNTCELDETGEERRAKNRGE